MIERLAARLEPVPAPGQGPRPPDDGQRRAAVAVVLHAGAGGPRVLLMKRAERQGDPWSGHVALPGGRHEPGDGDLCTTAIREAREELALELDRATLLGGLPSLHPRNAGPRGMEVTPYVFAVDEEPRPVPNAEAEATFWLPLALAGSGALDGTYAYAGGELALPCWTYAGHTIWGLTLRVLGDLLARAR